ncbi:uncharacterized protein LOC108204549 isoform X1 [Daucus carota subsp. sativus]|uniref:uncharacterized protein LOC108204549 isoform X1 n=2 Tax=Daucus carota subsp. sativus TaxID=79200 RepID=UPI0007EFF700|nr:PREDICTED: general transcription factor 3C polypeptide 3 isoform X1 [Daucus carota subsp. sativus]
MTNMEEDEQIATDNVTNSTSTNTNQTTLYSPLQLEAEDEYGDDDGNDDVGDEEEEEEEDDMSYKMRFEGEMDPLDFIENDASAVDKYHQFQRIENEYEALAARKQRIGVFIHISCGSNPSKKLRNDDDHVETFEEIMEAMAYNSGRKRRRKNKKKGRRRGSKKKVNPVVARKLGEATLHYSNERYEEARCLLKEVIRLDPYLPDPYYKLGLVYEQLKDKKKQMGCYMLAAHSSPKDGSLWKLLVLLSVEEGNNEQAMYCLSKAITADPQDLSLRFDRASLYVELGDYLKAAESYEQISRLRPELVEAELRPELVEALKKATKLYQKCGQRERAVSILEEYVKRNQTEAEISIIYLLVSMLIEGRAYIKALNHIEHAQQVYCAGKEFPLPLTIKAGVCQAHLGNLEKAEAIFCVLQRGNACDRPQIVTEVADSLANLKHYELALKYYMMLEAIGDNDSGVLYSRIAECNLHLGDRLRSIEYYYKALPKLNDSVDTRLKLASLLLEESKDDEAISILCPPTDHECTYEHNLDKPELWWTNFTIKLKLSQIYKDRGSLDSFVDTIYPCVRKSFLEAIQQKDRAKRKLTRSELFERAKVLDNRQNDNVFHGFRPMASTSDLTKATRAKKLLQKKEALREEKRAAALAAGVEYKSDESDVEPPQVTRRRPLPNLLVDEEYHCLIIDLCKSLASLQKYWEALEIIDISLKLACSTLSVERKEELRSIGAQIAYNIGDPSHGWDCARYIVNQHPYSFAAWNCYYKVISRLDNRYSKHGKFLHSMRVKHKDCVPPYIIFGHQLTMISQHQAAAKDYLEAYKLMPDNPLINLCVGSALINLALGHRLQNKHQCVMQGLAFLFKNLLLSENSQEALYNIARAYHHVGLVTLAATFYEKVLAIREKDYPIPKLPNENQDGVESRKPGYCDLGREAAYNLHLIYKSSGAVDLARQVLKDHCSF